MIFAYLRVSTTHQNTDRQNQIKQGADKIFTEKASAKSLERPQLQRLLDQIRSGDTVIAYSIDRLARNIEHLLSLAKTIKEHGATLTFVKENLHIAPDAEMSATDKLMFQMMGVFAEFERELMLERQRESRAAGHKPGPKKLLDANQELDIVRKYQAGVSKARLAKDFGVSRHTIARTIQQQEL